MLPLRAHSERKCERDCDSDVIFWSFDRKTLLDDKAKAQKLISVISSEMCAFQIEMHILL